MPNNYKKTKVVPAYGLADVKRGEKFVKEGMTYREAHKLSGVPRSVLQRYIKGGCKPQTLGSGRSSILSTEVEEVLEKCLVARSIMGYPCNRSELKDLVHEYVIANGMITPFSNGKPGNKWYANFMRRHPKLSLKKPEQIQKVRITSRDPFVVYSFFDMVGKLYEACQITASSAPFIFNADESGFGSDPSRLRGIGQKGVALNRISDGSGRESTSVLGCVSASGDCLPPLIVFKGKSVQPRWVSREEFPGTMYAATENGWMGEPTFFQWFTKMFISHVNTIREESGQQDQAAVLFFDGHSSHISLRIVEMALSNNVHLVKFPSHLTDKLQPLDVCVFGPIKTAWDKALVVHGNQRMGVGPARLQKTEFGTLLAQVWKNIPKRNIVSGFRTTGLFPLDKEKVPERWFNPSALQRYIREQAMNNNNPDIGAGDSVQIPVPTISHSDLTVTGTSSEIQSEAIDLSLPKRDEVEDKNGPSAVDIVTIFSASISKNTAVAGPSKAPVPRLKHHYLGEVLTTVEVSERLKEAEEKRNAKKRPATKPKPSSSKKPCN